MLTHARFALLAILASIASISALAASIDDDPNAWNFSDGSITLQCVGPDGEPILGAELQFAAWDYDMPPEAKHDIVRARAGANGKHVFENLSGTSHYSVYATSGEMGCWNAELGVKPSEKHRTVKLKLGIYNSVSGRIVDDQGNPVPDVHIRHRGVIEGAVTDAQGSFRVRHISEQKEFEFYKPGFGWINSGLIPTTRTMEIMLPRGGLCEFTVLDANQKPVRGAKVTYQGGNVYYGGGAMASAVTDEAGKAVSTWLPANTTTDIHASYERDGYYWNCSAKPEVRAGETIQVILEPKASHKIRAERKEGSAEIEKKYERIDGPRGVVRGRVVMEDSGEPVIASILYDHSKEWVDDAKGMTNDDGSFTLEGMNEGSYFITAFPRDSTYYTIGGLTNIIVSNDKPVTNLEFKIAKGCAIRGDVKSADGLPVANAQVRVEPDNLNHYQAYWTDAKGHFFIPHITHPNKELTVVVHAPRDLGAEKKVGPIAPGTISDPIEITIDNLYLAQTSGKELHGKVIDENDNPVTAVNVSLPTNIATDTCITNDTGAFTLNLREAGSARFTVRSDRSVLLNGEIESDRSEYEIIEGGIVTVPQSGPVADHVIRVRTAATKAVGGFVMDESGAPLNANMMVYVADCQGTGRANKGAFLKLGCSKPFTQGPVLLEFTLQGYQARVLESGRDFELGDTNIRVVMKKGPFEPFTSVFAAVTGRDPKEADRMFRGDRILDNCGDYWNLAGGASNREAPIWLVVRDEKGAPVTQIKTQPTTGPIIHSQDDEKKYANTIAPLSNERGQYTLKQGGVFVWADGKSKVYFHHPNGNRRGEPVFITLEPEATLTVKVVDSDGSPVKDAVVSLINEDKDKDWPRYIDSSPPRIPTGSTGTVVFAKLPAGNYELNAWVQYIFSATRSGQQTIQLKAGETRSITLVLKP